MPIKKEKTQSALNNFDEFTMVSPSILAQCIGFTEAEVQKLSDKYHQDFDKVKKWYDGYLLKDYQVQHEGAVPVSAAPEVCKEQDHKKERKPDVQR